MRSCTRRPHFIEGPTSVFRKYLVASLLALTALAVPSLAQEPQSESPLFGNWRNPTGSVTIRIANCGASTCGIVIGATPGAIADARDSGYPNLLGMLLLSGGRADRSGQWHGTILVPDMGRSFSAHISLIDSNHARVTGCLWRSLFCQSQTWQRV